MADFYLGQIITFGGNFAIFGTAMCNGQLMSIAQNPALFAVIGTTYGGDGISTFGVPNLQSRRMNHMGTGPGRGTYVLGQQSGVEHVTLTSNTMPTHTHVMTSSFQASGAQPHASLVTPPTGGVLGHAVDIAPGGKAAPAIYCPSGTTANVDLGGLNVAAANTGGSLPLQILTPYLAITMLIMLQGIFPSRN
jgi:microcystin-dependent protein